MSATPTQATMSDDISSGGNFSQLLKTVGNWGRPSGRGLYMFRSMIVASSSAALVGLAMAVGGAVFLSSGGLGFMIGSCMGFVGAAAHYYHMSLMQAFVALEDHPRIMQLHLAYNFPWMGFQRLNSEQLRRDWWKRKWARQGNLIAAWHSASGALDEIHDRRNQLLVDDTVEKSIMAEAQAAVVGEGGRIHGKDYL
ncbi:hypothetical protein F5Y15DRAFT_383229 [Xylariaceae sp. FL0016]|nr:hypothetical protein F5Y15DRAFT_383229 [Xylariaceae sp. FL0016]